MALWIRSAGPAGFSRAGWLVKSGRALEAFEQVHGVGAHFVHGVTALEGEHGGQAEAGQRLGIDEVDGMATYTMDNNPDLNGERVATDVLRWADRLQQQARTAVADVHVAASEDNDATRQSLQQRFVLLSLLLTGLLLGTAALIWHLARETKRVQRLSLVLAQTNQLLESRVTERTRQIEDGRQLLSFILNASPSDEFTFTVPVNTPGGKLQGVELNYVQPFTFLPGKWSNLGVQLNYTWVESKIQYINSAGQPVMKTDLTGLSKSSWNATLFYEGEKFAGRISATNRDDYLTQAPGQETGFNLDGYHGMTGTTVFDASIRYKISDKLELSLEGINLTDEPQESWVSNPSVTLPLDYSETGRQYLLGLRYKF